mgnify:FL=1
MNVPAYVIALHEKGRIIKETYEAVSFAMKLSDKRPSIVVLSGEKEVEFLSRELSQETGLDVACLTGSMLRE